MVGWIVTAKGHNPTDVHAVRDAGHFDAGDAMQEPGLAETKG